MAIADRTLAAPGAKAHGQRLQLAPILIIATAAIVVIGLLRIVQTSEATTATFAMTDMRQEKLELETSVRQLEAEVASLSSLDRIRREAARLGLRSPVGVSYLEVNANWPLLAVDRLPERFIPVLEEQVDGSPGGSGWWQVLLKPFPF